MIVTLEEARQYLRLDSSDEDDFITGLIAMGEQMSADIARVSIEQLAKETKMARISILYVVAYLYEHREEADHGDLAQTLRSLLFGIRREVF